MPLRRDELDRRIVGMAVLALGALAIEPLYVLVDTAIVGHLGTTPLAALALAATVLLTVVAGCNFLAYGTTQRVANHLGAGRREDAAGTGVQALWLCVLLGVPLAAGVALVARPAVALLGGEGEALDLAVQYLRISAVGLPFVLVSLAGQGVLRGGADLRTPLLVVAAANVANVVLEVVAVYGLDLGIAGSAWSTVIVQVLAAAAYLLVLRPHLRAARRRRPDRTEAAPLLSAGRHLVVRVGAMLVVFVGAAAVAGRIDVATLAAQQITMQTFNILALGLDAFAIPAQTLVADALGQDDVDRAAGVGRAVTRLSLLAASGLAVALVVLSPLIPQVFTDDAAVASRATAGLLVLAVVLVPGGVAFALDGVLIGAGDYRFLSRASVLYLGAFVPVAALTLAVPALGIVGIWLAMLCWMLVRAGTNQWRFISRRWASSPVAR